VLIKTLGSIKSTSTIAPLVEVTVLLDDSRRDQDTRYAHSDTLFDKSSD
jgi:hypothetical protein